MNNKTYDILKWVAIIGIPAVAMTTGTIGGALGWEHTELTVTIITALGTGLGAILGVSANQYNKTNKE